MKALSTPVGPAITAHQTTRSLGGKDARAVAIEFEGVMLQELVKAMRATTSIDGQEPESDQMVEHLIDQALADNLAKAGGIGLADYLASDEASGADDTLTLQGRVGADGPARAADVYRRVQDRTAPASGAPETEIDSPLLREK